VFIKGNAFDGDLAPVGTAVVIRDGECHLLDLIHRIGCVGGGDYLLLGYNAHNINYRNYNKGQKILPNNQSIII
jgi:hypothetical protein